MPPANQATFPLSKEELYVIVTDRFNEGKSDVEIKAWIQDVKGHDIHVKTIQRARKVLDLKNAWNAKLKPEDIADDFAEMREIFPAAGAVRMKSILRVKKQLRVSHKVIGDHMRQVEPAETAARKGRSLQRQRLYIAGVNVTWAMDQHDKWRAHGLLLHVGLDVCSGYILWAKIWWNNRNPNLICGYYLDAAKDIKGIPLLTQSDGGSENYNVAKAQTFLRQALDPTLEGTLQHKWMGTKLNTTPEVFWSGLRRTWTPGFENLILEGVGAGIYDADNILQKLVFRFLAIPWLQQELDEYRQIVNETKKRRDKNKLLPQGRTPQDVFQRPGRSGTLDFKVGIDAAKFEDVHQRYAPRDHPVLQLVPADFEVAMRLALGELGNPVIDRHSFWHVYQDTLRLLETRGREVDAALLRQIEADERMQQEEVVVEAARWNGADFGDAGRVEHINVGAEALCRARQHADGGVGEEHFDAEVDADPVDAGRAFYDDEGMLWIPGLGDLVAADSAV